MKITSLSNEDPLMSEHDHCCDENYNQKQLSLILVKTKNVLLEYKKRELCLLEKCAA